MANRRRGSCPKPKSTSTHRINGTLSQINVFLGIKVYLDPANPGTFRRWWMGLYMRDIHSPNPTQANPGHLLPRPIRIGQLPHPPHDLLTTVQNQQWVVPIDVLFYPIPFPPNPPSTPANFGLPAQGFVLDVDQLRRVILSIL